MLFHFSIIKEDCSSSGLSELLQKTELFMNIEINMLFPHF